MSQKFAALGLKMLVCLCIGGVVAGAAATASAMEIEQGGVTYSCTPVSRNDRNDRNDRNHRDDRRGRCQTRCVTYCSSYDKWPFADRCLSRASECGPNAEVNTTCGQYDDYPFQDRCLQNEDVVTTDSSC